MRNKKLLILGKINRDTTTERCDVEDLLELFLFFRNRDFIFNKTFPPSWC